MNGRCCFPSSPSNSIQTPQDHLIPAWISPFSPNSFINSSPHYRASECMSSLSTSWGRLLLFSVPTLCTKTLQKGHFHRKPSWTQSPSFSHSVLSLPPESTDAWIPEWRSWLLAFLLPERRHTEVPHLSPALGTYIVKTALTAPESQSQCHTCSLQDALSWRPKSTVKASPHCPCPCILLYPSAF